MNRQEIIIYKTKDGKASMALFAHDGDIWLGQNQLAELFSTSKPKHSQHISNILKEKTSFPRFLSEIHGLSGSPIEAFGDD